MRNKDKPFVTKVLFPIGLIFLLIGLFLLIVSFIINSHVNEKTKDYVEIKAEIYEIKTSNNMDNDGTFWVKYTVNGEEYTANTNSYLSSKRIGDKITISYDPNNPSEINYNLKISTIIFYVVGGLCALIGLIILIINSRRNSNIYLIETGIPTEAFITYNGVTNVTINNSPTYIVKAQATDDMGVVRNYKSKLLENPFYTDQQTITVYIDPFKRKKYYMDCKTDINNF